MQAVKSQIEMSVSSQSALLNLVSCDEQKRNKPSNPNNPSSSRDTIQ
jgi:hypothetical protein